MSVVGAAVAGLLPLFPLGASTSYVAVCWKPEFNKLLILKTISIKLMEGRLTDFKLQKSCLWEGCTRLIRICNSLIQFIFQVLPCVEGPWCGEALLLEPPNSGKFTDLLAGRSRSWGADGRKSSCLYCDWRYTSNGHVCWNGKGFKDWTAQIQLTTHVFTFANDT